MEEAPANSLLCGVSQCQGARTQPERLLPLWNYNYLACLSNTHTHTHECTCAEVQASAVVWLILQHGHWRPELLCPSSLHRLLSCHQRHYFQLLTEFCLLCKVQMCVNLLCSPLRLGSERLFGAAPPPLSRAGDCCKSPQVVS